MDWELPVKYGNTWHRLQAEKIYESDQIIRIRVHGKHSSIVLENDYPLLQRLNSRKRIKWTLREGMLDGKSDEDDSALLVEIIMQLEQQIKGTPSSVLAYLRDKP